jgi:hypothetical protein
MGKAREGVLFWKKEPKNFSVFSAGPESQGLSERKGVKVFLLLFLQKKKILKPLFLRAA